MICKASIRVSISNIPKYVSWSSSEIWEASLSHFWQCVTAAKWGISSKLENWGAGKSIGDAYIEWAIDRCKWWSISALHQYIKDVTRSSLSLLLTWAVSVVSSSSYVQRSSISVCAFSLARNEEEAKGWCCCGLQEKKCWRFFKAIVITFKIR